MASAYWGELRTHWKPLLAATLGLGVGVGLSAYTAGIFAPRLIGEFGWSRSQFALLGSFSLLMIILQPITGRLTDRYGVRTISAIGVLAGPTTYVALSMQPGDIRVFFAIVVLQIVVGTLTTSPVYTRIVAERFDRARGLAFSIVMTGPPLVGAVLAPIIGRVIDAQGWRVTYLALAVVTFTLGMIAVLFTPRHRAGDAVAVEVEAVTLEPVEIAPVMQKPGPRPVAPMRQVFRTPAFWVLIVGMVLVNVPQGLFSHQMMLMLVDSGARSQAATWLISVFAIGVIVGRFGCGLSLDRYRPHLVAVLALGMPAIGMVVLATPFDAMAILVPAVALMGLAQGAEGDIAAYLVSRRFELGVFSVVLGFVGAAIASGGAIGALLLSVTLAHWESYTPFLLISAGATLVGALLFLTLGGRAGARENAA